MSESSTFIVEIDGTGSFEIKRNTMSESMRVGAEYNRLVEGQSQVYDYFGRFCVIYATLKIMIVKSPPGFDIDKMDPNNDTTFSLFYELYNKIQEREEFFRTGSQSDGKTKG
jgi:hypothetical protein